MSFVRRQDLEISGKTHVVVAVYNDGEFVALPLNMPEQGLKDLYVLSSDDPGQVRQIILRSQPTEKRAGQNDR